MAALASPTTPQTQTPNTSNPYSSSSYSSSHSKRTNRHTSSSSISVSSNPFLATLSPISPLPSPEPLSSNSGSLLDDEPDEIERRNEKALGDVMVPNVVSPATDSSKLAEQKSLLDDDDDWNW